MRASLTRPEVIIYPFLQRNRPYHVGHYGICKSHISLLLNSYFLPCRPPLEVKESRLNSNIICSGNLLPLQIFVFLQLSEEIIRNWLLCEKCDPRHNKIYYYHALVFSVCKSFDMSLKFKLSFQNKCDVTCGNHRSSFCIEAI